MKGAIKFLMGKFKIFLIEWRWAILAIMLIIFLYMAKKHGERPSVKEHIENSK